MCRGSFSLYYDFILEPLCARMCETLKKFLCVIFVHFHLLELNANVNAQLELVNKMSESLPAIS